MSDLIDRQKAIDVIQQRADRVDSVFSAFWEGLIIAQDIVKNIPSAKSEERVVRVKPRGRLTEWADCECGQAVHMGWSYCPFCGAKLERK